MLLTSYKYIEIFILILLTIGPINSNYKILIYFLLFLINYKYLLNLFHLKKMSILVILLIILAMILDIRNIDDKTPYSLVGFLYLFAFVSPLIYIKKYTLKEFMYILEKISFFVASISIIGMFILDFVPSLIRLFPLIEFSGRKLRSIIIFNVFLI